MYLIRNQRKKLEKIFFCKDLSLLKKSTELICNVRTSPGEKSYGFVISYFKGIICTGLGGQ